MNKPAPYAYGISHLIPVRFFWGPILVEERTLSFFEPQVLARCQISTSELHRTRPCDSCYISQPKFPHNAGPHSPPCPPTPCSTAVSPQGLSSTTIPSPLYSTLAIVGPIPSSTPTRNNSRYSYQLENSNLHPRDIRIPQNRNYFLLSVLVRPICRASPP